MKKMFLICIFINLLTVMLLGESFAPLITHHQDKFLLEYISIQDDSVYSFSQKLVNDGDCAFFRFNGKRIDIPLFNELIASVDTVQTAENIIVLSDIEGNFEAFYKLLHYNNLIDEAGNWKFGKGHLVIAGDMVNRGEFVDESLLLLYKLEHQAFAQGGRVHYLLGNHDMMLIKGDLRYVHKKYFDIAKAQDKTVDELYNKNSLLGKWIRNKNAILKINDIIIVHGGLSPELVIRNYSVNEINTLISQHLNENISNERINFLLKSYGPFWYRGMMRDYRDIQKISQSEFDTILDYYKANKVIIGHTVVDNISYDYHEKLICVDVDHHECPQALLIKGKDFYRIFSNKKKEILK